MITSWEHERLGEIEQLPKNLRPHKVWKHFYYKEEHWERICKYDVESMRTVAEDIVGIFRHGHEDLPWISRKQWYAVKKLLQRHHDDAYSDIYLLEMASPNTWWSPDMDKRHRHQALTPRSVFIVVQLDQPASWIVTAFRPHPKTKNVKWTEDEFRRTGEEHFLRVTKMNKNDFASVIARNILQATTIAPESVKDLWWLASAIGYGRMLTTNAEVSSALVKAEQLLGGVSEELKDDFKEILDWDGCLDDISSGLKDDYPEDFEHALSDSEELLAIANAIGAAKEAEAFMNSAEGLIAWIPGEWNHLLDHASARIKMFEASDSLVLRLWGAVEESVIGATMRETEPVVRPEASLVDQIIPSDSLYTRWINRTAKFAGDITTEIGQFVNSSINAFDVGLPAPMMGNGMHTNKFFEVRVSPEEDAYQCRVFVINEKYPDGYELTDRYTKEYDYLCRMNVNYEYVLIILIASERSIEGDTLESILNIDTQKEDIVVKTRKISPPK